MKRLFSIFVLAVIAFAACTTDVTKDVTVEVPETLTVSFEESSRIQLNEGKTVWTTGDLVSVFYRSDANQQWKFNGQTGATTAELTKVVEPEATNTLSKVVTIYPYNENYTIDAECKVTATLPAEQEYLADSFGVGSSIMVAESESNNAQLRNAMGWLRLHLTGDGEVVKSITVKGNNSEQVAGQITINPSDASITLAESSTATTVTLHCTDGVTLSSEETAFYIALPPQEFEGGITAEINCNDGSKMVKSTSNSVTIKRNTIQPMDAMLYEPKIFELAYTTNNGQPLDLYTTEGFGANFLENIYDADTGKGSLKFDGRITAIPANAFDNCNNLVSITIPYSVTKSKSYAFRNCSNLKNVYYQGNLSKWCNIEFITTDANPLFNGAKLYIDNKEVIDITIPSDITTIGNCTFYGCTSLKSVTIPNSVTAIEKFVFSNCDNLASITISDNINLINSFAFSNCSSLKNVYYQGDLSAWCKIKFENDDANPLSNKARLYIGNEVVTNITIPSDIISIRDYAFYGCIGIQSIIISDSVTQIGSSAFENTDFKEIYCKSTTPPTGNSGMFGFIFAGKKIYVPKSDDNSIIESYKTADGWKFYADYIEEYDFTE